MQTDDEKLNLTFGALADATRPAMLVRITQGPATAKELVELFDIGKPAIYNHLTVLERARLIERGRETPVASGAATNRAVGGCFRSW